MKITEFENPMSGKKGNVTRFSDWWGLILGVGVLLVVFNLGQRIANIFTRRVPGNISPGFTQPVFGQAAIAPPPSQQFLGKAA